MAGRPWHTDNRGAAGDGGDAHWIGAGYGLGGRPRQLDRAAPTLIEHWNGTAWKRVPSPNPSSAANLLSGVAAVSATGAWAAGNYGDLERTFTLHWNGAAWKRVPSPNPAGSDRANSLFDVAATSSTGNWAVGYYFNGAANQALALHWR